MTTAPPPLLTVHAVNKTGKVMQEDSGSTAATGTKGGGGGGGGGGDAGEATRCVHWSLQRCSRQTTQSINTYKLFIAGQFIFFCIGRVGLMTRKCTEIWGEIKHEPGTENAQRFEESIKHEPDTENAQSSEERSNQTQKTQRSEERSNTNQTKRTHRDLKRDQTRTRHRERTEIWREIKHGPDTENA